MTRTIQRALVSALFVSMAFPAWAQLAVSSNDRQQVLEGGVIRPVRHASTNTISVLDLGSSPVKLLWELDGVPGSVVGPPSTVAVAPDESIAIVAASTRIDPGDPEKAIPDSRVTVIDLKRRRVIQRLHTGAGAAGISITRDGTHALVASRQAGTVEMFIIIKRVPSFGNDLMRELASAEKRVAELAAYGPSHPEMVRAREELRAVQAHIAAERSSSSRIYSVSKVKIGPPEALVSHVALSRDGKTGVVTHRGAHKISVIRIDGNAITVTGELSSAGTQPHAAAVHPDGKVALVANHGEGKSDSGTIVLVDLAAGKLIGAPVPVGFESLEGMQMSDDGVWVAAVCHAGSTRPNDSPLFKDYGMVVLYRFDAATNTLTRTADARIGRWARGAAFSKDGKTLLVQNMVENDIQVFRLDDGKLMDTGERIKVRGGAAAIRTSSGL